ncbi:MAG: branched-chain amino acid ABC transporter permease [Rhodospirillales bacterium]|nr:branched-chain amino acid ABC transporter permease [Rhodospirillales bacterium]MDE2198329.1 branched-chain amino acid ABC transporter permease [Rhodospirillales bacterium]MDE2575510.1 branched-chain amino acid ABC transporter permease [Rhodospirillales bacterium]
MSAAAPHAAARAALREVARWKPAEYAFWAATAASWFLLPGQHLLLNEIAIFALFALSLDLVLGFGGIVSLGHAAYFGFGGYAAGMLAQAGYTDPLLGLAAAALASAALGFVTSFLVLRGSDLTRIMVTLSVSLVLFELANRLTWLTGGADGLQGITIGPLLGRFDFDLAGHVAYAYSLVVLFVLFLAARRIVHSPFGWTVRAVRGNALRAAAIGLAVDLRLVGIYTMAALYAGIAGALLAQSTQFVSLDMLAFHRSADLLLMLVIGGVGYLYGGMIGALVFKAMQNWVADITPEYWQFWIGLLLVLLVVIGRERIFAGSLVLARRAFGRRG